MSAQGKTAPAKKALKVHVLRCRGESCDALLAFEENSEGFLLGNMIEVAENDGGQRYFPCPGCGGRNLVEEVEHQGKWRTRVFGFVAASGA